MSHRPPTRADIGREVQFLLGEEWQPAELKRIQTDTDGTYYHVYWINSDMTAGRLMGCAHCRVPYTCPDPEAELSQAADWMADHGHDEAARVLMQFLAMDPATQATFLAYRPGDSVTLYHTLLNELVP